MRYELKFLAPTLLYTQSMELIFSGKLLKHLSKEISSGNAVWALLTANEYLEKDDPVRKALVRHAERSNKVSISSDIICMINDGAKLSDLPHHLRDEVRTSSCGFSFPQKQRSIPSNLISLGTRQYKMRRRRVAN